MAGNWLIVSIIGFVRDVKNWVLPPDQVSPRELAAYHEAGHAVAAVAVGVGVDRASVVGDHDTLGLILLAQGWPHLRPGFDPHDSKSRRVAEDWILLALAGECAESYRIGRKSNLDNPGAQGDLVHAKELAKCLFAQSRECDAFIEEMQHRTHRFVREALRWRQISAVAAQLARSLSEYCLSKARFE